MKPFAILFVFTLLVTLLFLKKDNPVVIAAHSTHFPVVINKYLRNPDTIQYFESNELTNALPIFMGKHRLSDTILLDEVITYFKEGVDKYELIKSEKSPDSLNFNNLQVVVDYESTIPILKKNWVQIGADRIYAYFPVYILNNNQSERYFNFESIYAKGLQYKDAIYFEPIEYFNIQETCFDLNYFIKLLPGEFVLVLFRKYDGDTKGPLRIMIENYGCTFNSAPFIGVYNKSQVNFGPDYHNGINPYQDALSHIYYYFLGRLPQQFLIPN